MPGAEVTSRRRCTMLNDWARDDWEEGKTRSRGAVLAKGGCRKVEMEKCGK